MNARLRNRIASLAIVALAVLAGACSPARAPDARDSSGIAARVRNLLSTYASNDPDAVLRLCEGERVVVYGSDVSEVARGASDLRRMMADDFKLWGSAHFGEPKDLEIREGEDLASAFFQVPFAAAGRPAVMVRLATVWRKVHGEWLLVEASTSVPTTGSSARELLSR